MTAIAYTVAMSANRGSDLRSRNSAHTWHPMTTRLQKALSAD